jgi:hypothetical protein
MVEVNIKLSDQVAHALGNNTEAVTRRILENAAIENYRVGRLSQRQVGEMLGLDYWQTERFLTENQVAMHYQPGDLEADEAALAKVLGSK